ARYPRMARGEPSFESLVRSGDGRHGRVSLLKKWSPDRVTAIGALFFAWASTSAQKSLFGFELKKSCFAMSSHGSALVMNDGRFASALALAVSRVCLIV